VKEWPLSAEGDGVKISSESFEDVTVVRLEGHLDIATSNEAQDRLNRLIDEGAVKILVNLAAVELVTSAGLRTLLSTAKRLSSSGGDLRISNLSDPASEVFEISGFSTILSVFDSEDEALQGF